jgi:hypothetical protein
MFDLAIAGNGDLIMAGNSDLAGISGTDLLEQRMRLRLVLHRGTWAYDRDGTLGSSLYRLIGMAPDDANAAVEPYVREALRPMSDEITVDQVWHSNEIPVEGATPRGITIVVVYRIIPSAEAEGESDVQRQVEISLPLGGI